MGFETPEEGYLAKILVGEGVRDVPIGKVRSLRCSLLLSHTPLLSVSSYYASLSITNQTCQPSKTTFRATIKEERHQLPNHRLHLHNSLQRHRHHHHQKLVPLRNHRNRLRLLVLRRLNKLLVDELRLHLTRRNWRLRRESIFRYAFCFVIVRIDAKQGCFSGTSRYWPRWSHFGFRRQSSTGWSGCSARRSAISSDPATGARCSVHGSAIIQYASYNCETVIRVENNDSALLPEHRRGNGRMFEVSCI